MLQKAWKPSYHLVVLAIGMYSLTDNMAAKTLSSGTEILSPPEKQKYLAYT